MKKLVSLVLALCLLCGAVALAAESTMTLTLDLQRAYVLSIPATAGEFASNGGDGYISFVDVTVTGNLPEGVTALTFTVMSDALKEDTWALSHDNGENYIKYTMYASLPDEADNKEVTPTDNTIMTVTAENYTDGSWDHYGATLSFTTEAVGDNPNGTYTDILTFTVSEVEE